jgi:pimeloyl-ACP methyl ester carboxylesterase
MRQTSLYKSAAGEKLLMNLYDKIMAKWPVPCRQLHIATRYRDTFIIESGQESAKPLILLHGSCSNALSWMADIPRYCRHFRVYAVDIIGEPGKSFSGKPEAIGFAFGEWMEDVLNSLKIDRTMMAGMSYGGWAALKFATYRPERVEKLALITPGGIIPIKKYFACRDRLYMKMGKWGARKINRILFGNLPVPADVINYMDLIMSNIRTRNASMPVFSDEELKKLTMPTLLLGGLKDPIQNIAKVVSRMNKLLPHLTVKTYAEGGHILPYATKEIVSFLLGQ